MTNHGPETLREYFEQRRRIARGHYWLDFAFGYSVATLDQGILLRTAIDVATWQRRGLATTIVTPRGELLEEPPGYSLYMWDKGQFITHVCVAGDFPSAVTYDVPFVNG